MVLEGELEAQNPEKEHLAAVNCHSWQQAFLGSYYELYKTSSSKLWLVYLLRFLESYCYFTFSYSMIVYLSIDLGYEDEQAGWLYGAFNTLLLVYTFFLGSFIDSRGLRQTLLVGSTLLFFSRLIVAFSSNETTILVLLLTILPGSAAVITPCHQIYVDRYIIEKNRTTAYGLFYILTNLACLMAASLIDVVRSSSLDEGLSWHVYGRIRITLTGFQFLFMTGATVSSIVLILSFIFLTEDENDSHPRSKTKVQEKKSWKEILHHVIKEDSFQKLAALITFLSPMRMLYRYVDTILPKYLIREFGEEVKFGSIIAINPMLTIVLVPFFAAFTRDVSAVKQIFIGCLISACSPFAMVVETRCWTAIAFISVLTIGEALWSPRLFEYTISVAKEGYEGTYMSLVSLPALLTTLMSGGISGYLLQEYEPVDGDNHPKTLWTILGFSSLLSPVLFSVFFTYLSGTQSTESKLQTSPAGASDDEEEAPLLPSDECI